MADRLTKRILEHVYYTKGKYKETLPSECETSDVRAILRHLAEIEDAEEQQNKGCKYCLGENPTPIVNLNIENDDVYKEDITLDFAEPLRFCPMCGRKLSEATQ